MTTTNVASISALLGSTNQSRKYGPAIHTATLTLTSRSSQAVVAANTTAMPRATRTCVLVVMITPLAASRAFVRQRLTSVRESLASGRLTQVSAAVRRVLQSQLPPELKRRPTAAH